jgi:acyl carrier protein
VNVKQELLVLMENTLHLGGRTASFTDDKPLLGSLPELDSMGVVALITAMEGKFSFVVEDDEIDGSVFRTLGTLAEFVNGKMGI